MSQFKKKLTAFTAMLAFLSVSGSAAFALSTGDMMGKTDNMQVTGDSALMKIKNTSDTAGAVGQVDWARFNVGKDQTVNFIFSKHSQTIINRVLGGQQSEILGHLINSCGSNCGYSGTGKVILINPAGVMFGAGSTVDLNSFTVSTFDFNGAKNLKGMTESALANYQSGVLNRLSPVIDKGTDPNAQMGDIHFDSHYTSQFGGGFTHDGVYYKPYTVDPNAKIALNGATFAKFYDGEIDSWNTNKEIALVGNHIEYKNSLLRTGDNLNYGNYTQGIGGVKLITADGVTFSYTNTGYIQNKNIDADQRTDVARTIDIDNSLLGSGEEGDLYLKYQTDDVGNTLRPEAITTGDVDIWNVSKAGRTDGKAEVNITNSVIRAGKLVKGSNGDIYIASTKNVNIENSRLNTENTFAEWDGQYKETDADRGGRVIVTTGKGHHGETYSGGSKNITIKDSFITTAGSTAKGTAETDGGLRLVANDGGSIILNGTEALVEGNAVLDAARDVTIQNSMIETTHNDTKNINILSGNNISVNNSKIVSEKDLTMLAKGNSINVTSNLTNGHNQSLLLANGKLSVQANNTNLANTTLVYDTLKFYNDGSDVVNNVTIAGNTNFSNVAKNLVDVDLETNGNLTLDNATAKISNGFAFNLDRKANGKINDNGYKTNFGYTFTDGDTEYANDVTLTSKTGNVNVINTSAVLATNDININAAKDVNVKDSGMVAGNDLTSRAKANTNVNHSTLIAAFNNVDISSENGDVEIANNSEVTATNKNVSISAENGTTVINGKTDINAEGNIDIYGKTDVVIQASDLTSVADTTITADTGSMYIAGTKIIGDNITATSQDTIEFGLAGSGKNVEKDSRIIATNNLTFTSKAGDIISEKSKTATLGYGNVTFDAAGTNQFSSLIAEGSDGNLKSVNATYKAGVKNEFNTDGDIQFTNSTLNSKVNNINSGDDVIMNNLVISAAGTGLAADQVETRIIAQGDVTTEDVTKTFGADNAANAHTFPNDVDVSFNPPEGLPEDATFLDVGGTKVYITAGSNKIASDPSRGSVTLNVKGTGANAGLEIVAENTDYDTNIRTYEGPEVHLKSADGSDVHVSKIITDKLWLNVNDKYVASTIRDPYGLDLDGFAEHGSNTSKGYIEVRDFGGLNLDADFDMNPTGITYDVDFQENNIVDPRDPDADLNVNEKHKIHFNNNKESFMLVYTKPYDCDPEPITPDPEPNADPTPTNVDSYINQIKLPKEIVETSKVSLVADNTVDQSANVMSAAAKIDLGQEANAEYDEDEQLEDY